MQTTNSYQESIFSVPKMDCPSEERLIRMALDGVEGLHSLSFDLAQRQVTAIHTGDAQGLLQRLLPLKLGAMLAKSQPAAMDAGYRKSIFSVPKMDCPSEERLIRMALGDVGDLHSLSFDLPQRQLTAIHAGDPQSLLARLQPLKLGAELVKSQPAAINTGFIKSIFSVPKMDCPSEERLIRMAVADVPNIQSMTFDLNAREVTFIHQGDPNPLLAKLEPLKLGAQLRQSQATTADHPASDKNRDAEEACTLWLLLAINAAMFVIEIIVGLIGQSTGLIADSLDMFADAAVYGLALYAVGHTAAMKARAAHLAGWLQLVLALGALSEVVRRFLFGSEPQSALMMGMGVVALIANVTCLMLISGKREHGVHMKASYIFSANDVIANLGVIAAGILVGWTGSPYPDFIIGTIIGLIVLNGARRILQLK